MAYPWYTGSPGIGGGIFGATTPPYVPPSPVGGGVWGTPMPGTAPAGGMAGVLGKIGGVFGVPQQPQQPSLFAGDPNEARRRAIMAAGAQMMAASGPRTQRMNAGQILSQGYLAGQKATDDYQQDSQRQAYMQSLVQQQQAEMEKQQRLQRLEEQRAKTMAGAGVPRTPQAWEEIGAQHAASGDVVGAESAFEMANKIRQQETAQYNAETNRKNAEREDGLKLERGDDGFYVFDPKTGTVKKGASWQQFAPEKAAKGDKPLTAEEQRQKQALGGQIAKSIAFFSNKQGGALPGVSNFYDRTVGRATGSEEYKQRRNMDMIVKNQVLQLAKFLRPVSNDEVKFLLQTMPLPDDPADVHINWLRQAAMVADIELPEEGGSSVAAEFDLEPAQKKTGSW